MLLLYFWILIQIIIESLPISSSGHVALIQKLFSKFGYSPDLFADAWIVDFVLHGPTIAILLIYFFKPWWNMVFHQSHIDFKIFLKKSTWLTLIQPLMFVSIADIITVIFWACGIAENIFISRYFLPIGFMITASALYTTRLRDSLHSLTTPRQAPGKLLKGDDIWNFTNAIILGIVQGLSLLPGISRFASTYSAARFLCHYDNSTSFALSFLIQLPLIGAGFLKGLIALQKYPELMAKLFALPTLLVMVIASFISYGLLCLVGVMIQKNTLYYFAFYMIIPIIISLIL
ncbi:MAG TPA: undecaprenyl-diphosphate phosphatase [Candidatus Saccharimonadales bacterium]|nr:undecaprenyl-diphosphate phosphatase [Candidatus Saccharimonadales bacterium]